MESNSPRLEQLMDYLQNMYGANQLQPLPNWPPNILDTIAAQFADDDAWYRGVVLRLQANKAEVRNMGLLLRPGTEESYRDYRLIRQR